VKVASSAPSSRAPGDCSTKGSRPAGLGDDYGTHDNKTFAFSITFSTAVAADIGPRKLKATDCWLPPRRSEIGPGDTRTDRAETVAKRASSTSGKSQTDERPSRAVCVIL